MPPGEAYRKATYLGLAAAMPASHVERTSDGQYRHPLLPRAIDRAAGERVRGPILLNGRSTRMDRYAATRRLQRLAGTIGLQEGPPAHAPPHLRHQFDVDLRDIHVLSNLTSPRLPGSDPGRRPALPM